MAKRPTTKLSRKMRTRATIHGVMAGVGAAGAAIGTVGAFSQYAMGDVPGGLLLTWGATTSAGLMSESLDARRRNRAKAYAYERGAQKRALSKPGKINSAGALPKSLASAKDRKTKAVTAWVKPHNAMSGKGNAYFVKGHFRKLA